MSNKRPSKKADNEKITWITLALILTIIIIVELVGNYCENHSEEHRQKEWEKFEHRMEEVHHMTKWN